MDGQNVVVRARVHTLRAQGSKMVFINLRQRVDSVQALLTLAEGKISKPMVKWVEKLQVESIVLVEGIVKKAPEEVKSASIGNVELHITRVGPLSYSCYIRSHLLSSDLLDCGFGGASPFHPRRCIATRI